MPDVGTPALATAVSSSVPTPNQVHAGLPTVTSPRASATTLSTSPTATALIEASVNTPNVEPTASMVITALPSSETKTCDQSSPLPATTPLEIFDLESGKTYFDEPYLYLALPGYIGLIDTADPTQPAVLGFWELLPAQRITGLVAREGMLFASYGSSVRVFDTSADCRFATLSELEMPFEVFHIEVHEDRLYVGGASDSSATRTVLIFSIQSPQELIQIGSVDLGREPITWSVADNKLFVLSDLQLSVTDVTDPTRPVTTPIDLDLDAEIAGLYRKVDSDELYYFSPRDGLVVVRALGEPSPVVQMIPKEHELSSVTKAITSLMQLDRDYVFLGINWCDVECVSAVTVVQRENLEAWVTMGLQPYYPVYLYSQGTQNFIYAFSEDKLLVLDTTDPKQPTIIQVTSLS